MNNEFPISPDSRDDEATSGHKVRWVGEAEDAVNRNIDEQTSGHRKRADLTDAEEDTSGHKVRWVGEAEDAVNRNIDEQTSGHRRIRADLTDADDGQTEGHIRMQ
jgi:hypothetical protein